MSRRRLWRLLEAGWIIRRTHDGYRALSPVALEPERELSASTLGAVVALAWGVR